MTATRFDSPTRSLGAFARDVFLHLRVDSVSRLVNALQAYLYC